MEVELKLLMMLYVENKLKCISIEKRRQKEK